MTVLTEVNGVLVPLSDPSSPCPKCGAMSVQGRDACLPHIPKATSACCGHGMRPAFVYFASAGDMLAALGLAERPTVTDDRIIEAVVNECWSPSGKFVGHTPLTTATVARAEVGVCPECHGVEPKFPWTGAVVRPCRHPFHDIHEAYERAKAERGLT